MRTMLICPLESEIVFQTQLHTITQSRSYLCLLSKQRCAASDSQTYIVPSDGALDDVPPVVCEDGAAVSSLAEETTSQTLPSARLRCSLGCD